jgi:V-type H+-transporting ATPase subunit C
MQELWLVTVPNGKGSPDKTYSALRDNVEATGNCRIHRFDIPSLVVGTLDSLMALSDDLSKINTQVEVRHLRPILLINRMIFINEVIYFSYHSLLSQLISLQNVVRKVERQYLEISGPSAESLRINSTKVETFLRKFQWDSARYHYPGRQLSEIVAEVQSMAARDDEDLKKLAIKYNEKTLALSTLQRKKTINVSTSDFEDFMKPSSVARLDLIDSETLLTVMVVVPSSLEKGETDRILTTRFSQHIHHAQNSPEFINDTKFIAECYFL